MKKKIKTILLTILILVLFFAGYLFFGKTKPAEKISWGVNFSQKHTELLGLNWQETYLALLNDLGVKNLKIITHWDLIEPREGEYNFLDLDWQIQKAQDYGANILLVIGMKTGRWPECHIPLEYQISNIKYQKLLEYVEKIVNRYKSSKAIWGWQVENEPFFPFGECPKTDKEFLKQEIALVKSLDPVRKELSNGVGPKRPIIISDSGEFSFWIEAAKLGDIVSTTLHRRVWVKELKIYVTHYWFQPFFYWWKAKIIKQLFDKEVICGELQAEPWGPVLLYDSPLSEQKKTMNLELFRDNIKFARKTGLKEFYLWGAEWWYWMREKQGKPEIWDEAEKLFETPENL